MVKQDYTQLDLRPLPDRLATGLRLVFCGINPSVMAAQLGHYYANPRNDFYRLLFAAGLTPRLYTPQEDADLLALGIGLTDIVKRPSPGQADVAAHEFAAGRPAFLVQMERYRPRLIGFNGLIAGQTALGIRNVTFGRQSATIAGARVFIAPSPSPRNARLRFSDKLLYFEDLNRWLKELEG